MKRGWQTAPLGDLTQFINGLWKGEEPPFVHVKVIRNTNFTKEGALDDTDIAHLDVEAKKFQKRKLQYGDLILEKSGGGPKQPVGRVVLFDKASGDYSFSNFTAAIRIADPTSLDSRFLHKYLHWVYVSGRTEAMQSHSTGIRNLNVDAYKAIKVVYPPLSEQRRIVAVLDDAFESIGIATANSEKNLHNAGELFACALTEVFSADWPLVRIDDACQSIMDCVNKTAPTVPEVTPYKMIRTTNVRNGVVSLTSVKHVSKAIFQAWTRRQVPLRGDVILTREAPMGEVGMLESDEPVFLGQRLVSYRADPTKLDARFLLYALQSQPLQRQIHALASGATVQHMRVPDSKNLLLPLPSLQSQRTAAKMLDEMRAETSRLRAVFERKIATLGELKKSLLHQAFTGALTAKSTDRQLEAAA